MNSNKFSEQKKFFCLQKRVNFKSLKSHKEHACNFLSLISFSNGTFSMLVELLAKIERKTSWLYYKFLSISFTFSTINPLSFIIVIMYALTSEHEKRGKFIKEKAFWSTRVGNYYIALPPFISSSFRYLQFI